MNERFLLGVFKIIIKFIPLNIIKKINKKNLQNANSIIKKLEKVRQNNSSLKEIQLIFLSSNINLKLKDAIFYYKVYDLIINNSNHVNNRNFIKKQLLTLNQSSVNYRALLKLRDVLYLKLEFFLGGVCRDVAINIAANSKVGIFFTKKERARARLELLLNYDHLDNYLKKNPIGYIFNKKIFNNFINSINEISIEGKQFKDSYENNKFLNNLNKKSIAVVGPAATGNKYASEIDSFDVVVRMNYTHSGKNLDTLEKGTRVDISYFNGNQIDIIIENNHCKLPNDLRIACIKDNSLDRFKKLSKANPRITIKKIKNYNILNFHSSYNLLPLILLDLLESNVKVIKIFHTDLFLTTKRDAGYKKKELSNLEFIQTFLIHDPLTHFKFIKRLYLKKRIIGDRKFDEVMKLSNYEYLNRLQELYK